MGRIRYSLDLLCGFFFVVSLPLTFVVCAVIDFRWKWFLTTDKCFENKFNPIFTVISLFLSLNYDVSIIDGWKKKKLVAKRIFYAFACSLARSLTLSIIWRSQVDSSNWFRNKFQFKSDEHSHFPLIITRFYVFSFKIIIIIIVERIKFCVNIFKWKWFSGGEEMWREWNKERKRKNSDENHL